MTRLGAIFWCLFLVLGCNKPDTSETATVEPSPITWTECSQTIGDHPCDFTLKDQQGEDWSLYDQWGTIIILDFSTAWCHYCQVAAGDVSVIEDMYADKRVTWVTVLVEGFSGEPADHELITAWSANFGIDSPVLAGNRALINEDPAAGWPLGGWPTFWIIDRELVIRENIKGYSSSSIMTTVDSMLVTEAQEGL